MSTIDARSSRSRRPVETKPFYMTSEFMVMTAMTVALFIASLAVDDVDSRLAWILGVSLVGIYILSRGIAKAGSSSRSYDPREDARPDDGYREAPLTRDLSNRSSEPRTTL
jgi:hypothetical protein